MSAETVIDSIITSAHNIAVETKNAALSYAEDAQTAALAVTSLDDLPVPVRPNPVIPAFLPDPDEAEEKFRTTFSELYNLLGPDFNAQIDAFLARFFPQIDECLEESIDTWLCNTINNGATGIPTDVENQIWERSRARELRDFSRKDEELVSGWAKRGFSLPTGALFNAQQVAQQDLTERISTHSRDVAIKQAEIQIETIKFAISEGIKLRLGALQVAVDYMRAWLDVSKISVEYANGILRSRTAFYGALAAYYGALIAGERLVYDWGNNQAVLTVEQQKAFVSLVNSNTNARVQAAISAASSVASIGAAALAAQNSMAHVSNETLISG